LSSSLRIPHERMADELDRMVYGKADWLRRFSGGKNKRPDHDIDRERFFLAVLRQAADDYRKAAGRDNAGTKGQTHNQG
jgi:hypothetical protein